LLLLIGICPYFFRRGIGKSWHTFSAILAGLLAGAVWIAGYAPQSEWFKERLPSLIEFIESNPWLSGLGDHILTIPCFIICGYAGLTILIDFITPVAKKGADEAEGAKRNRRSLSWYGARMAHIGVVMMFLGIAGAEGFGTDEMVALRVGETKQVAQRPEAPEEAAKVGYEVTFDEIKYLEDEHKQTWEAWVTVNKNGEFLTKMQPALAVYKRNQRTSEADIRRTVAGDLYLTLTNIDLGRQLINLRVLIKPLINWLWAGSIIMVIGSLLVLSSWLRRRKTESPKSK
ncbi:cytochrome c-type biogenesis CcmF C-terminal domain-containing protein, partial [Planctomycetota bacterium]